MNNLTIIQEASIGARFVSSMAVQCGVIPLDFGTVQMTVYPPGICRPHYSVLIEGDDLAYEFATFAEAMDFAADEGRLAMR
jgi:hypothetical protein